MYQNYSSIGKYVSKQKTFPSIFMKKADVRPCYIVQCTNCKGTGKGCFRGIIHADYPVNIKVSAYRYFGVCISNRSNRTSLEARVALLNNQQSKAVFAAGCWPMIISPFAIRGPLLALLTFLLQLRIFYRNTKS